MTSQVANVLQAATSSSSHWTAIDDQNPRSLVTAGLTIHVDVSRGPVRLPTVEEYVTRPKREGTLQCRRAWRPTAVAYVTATLP